MPDRVLIIEDDPRMRRVLQLVLTSQGYHVETAEDGRDGILKWKTFQPDLVFTDLKMPENDGMEVLKHGRTTYPEIPVIIFTAFGTIPTAVQAMREGAFDYITKPVDNDIILEKARTALAHVKKQGVKKLPPAAAPTLIGSSKPMEHLKTELELVAKTNTSVLITGESGTGKELAARTIHRNSPRKEGPFIRLNCAAIPAGLMESELFGHTKGAFTGAVQSRKGAFLKAHAGTLFLDEIGDMPYELQSKLLHAVEDKCVIPLGTTRPAHFDVKIISATNQKIQSLVQEKKFRPDLYFRLNSYALHLPALKQRTGDIPELVNHFAARFSAEFGQPMPDIRDSAMKGLCAYPWPGNVRELKNIIERLVLSYGNDSIDRAINGDMVSRYIVYPVEESAQPESHAAKDLPTREKEIIEQALTACGWNISKAARQLGITRNTVRYRIKKYGLAPQE